MMGPARNATRTAQRADPCRTGVPQRFEQAAEGALPEPEGRHEHEDRERDADRAEKQQPDLGRREPLAVTELGPDVVPHERQRSRTQVGHPDGIRQHEVAVELEHRREVDQHHVVVDEHEAVEHRREECRAATSTTRSRRRLTRRARSTDRRTTARCVPCDRASTRPTSPRRTPESRSRCESPRCGRDARDARAPPRARARGCRSSRG